VKSMNLLVRQASFEDMCQITAALDELSKVGGAEERGAPRSAATTGEYRELSELTGFRAFLAGLAGHAAAQATSLE
jgi:hypothetical protein